MKQGFTDSGAPTKMARKLKWVSLASEQAVLKTKIRWVFHDSMSTLIFFGGFLPPPDLSRNKKNLPTKLEVLRLADNQIGDQGAKALVTLLGDKVKGWSNGGVPQVG